MDHIVRPEKKLVQMEDEVYPYIVRAFEAEIIAKQDTRLLVERIIDRLSDFDHSDAVRSNIRHFQKLIGITEEDCNNQALFAKHRLSWQAVGVNCVEQMVRCDIKLVGDLLECNPQDVELNSLFSQIAKATDY